MTGFLVITSTTSPVFHTYDTPPEAVKVAGVPLQIVVAAGTASIAGVGTALTATVMLAVALHKVIGVVTVTV